MRKYVITKLYMNTISIREFKPGDKKALFVLEEELQDYLVEIDPLHRLHRLSGYGKKYIESLLKEIKSKNGAIFIADKDNIPFGFIAGIIEAQDQVDLMECIPTKAGRVLDLIVSKKQRGKRTGSLLIKKMEEYFQQQNCDVVRIHVFEPNNPARRFYKKLGYNERIIDIIKKLCGRHPFTDALRKKSVPWGLVSHKKT